jgi:hypothetical protein
MMMLILKRRWRQRIIVMGRISMGSVGWARKCEKAVARESHKTAASTKDTGSMVKGTIEADSFGRMAIYMRGIGIMMLAMEKAFTSGETARHTMVTGRGE